MEGVGGDSGEGMEGMMGLMEGAECGRSGCWQDGGGHGGGALWGLGCRRTRTGGYPTLPQPGSLPNPCVTGQDPTAAQLCWWHWPNVSSVDGSKGAT